MEASPKEAITAAQQKVPDVVLLRLGPGLDLFHEMTEILPQSFIVPFIQRDFSPSLREEALTINAHGFLNDELPLDEWMASIHAFMRQKQLIDDLKKGNKSAEASAGARARQANKEAAAQVAPPPAGAPMALRDRLPELYQDVLRRYEEGVKLVLQHRIYKMNDDVFEPFRQIARELFLADATARDAVQLHYQTLRKIVPSPDAPGARAYLEVGRTTIVGLLGDLLDFYREGRRNNALEGSSKKSDVAPPVA